MRLAGLLDEHDDASSVAAALLGAWKGAKLQTTVDLAHLTEQIERVRGVR